MSWQCTIPSLQSQKGGSEATSFQAIYQIPFHTGIEETKDITFYANKRVTIGIDLAIRTPCNLSRDLRNSPWFIEMP